MNDFNLMVISGSEMVIKKNAEVSSVLGVGNVQLNLTYAEYQLLKELFAASYRSKVKVLHPDVKITGSTAKFQALLKLKETLMA